MLARTSDASTQRINSLMKRNSELQEAGRKIIAELNESDWSTNDIASEKMDELTHQPFFRVMTVGSAGGMASFLASSFIKNQAIPFLASCCHFLQEQNAKDALLIGSLFMLYIVGTVAGTKLSYRGNQFWNPCADLNKLRALHVEYKANQEEINRLSRAAPSQMQRLT